MSDDVAQSMLAWQHSGFHVHHSVRLEADEALGMLQLARYAARAPVALERLQCDGGKKRVRLVSDKRDGPTAGTCDFDPLEFLALLLRRRLLRPPARPLAQARHPAASRLQALPHDPTHDAVPSWADLLRLIFDPLRCRRCGSEMRIIAFILDPEATASILRHLRRQGRDPYTMLDEWLLAQERAPL